MNDLEILLRRVPEEGLEEPLPAPAPPGLSGDFLFVGPMEHRGSRPHWLDGDGMACRLRVRDGRATWTNRFVDCPRRVQERAAGRSLFRGFGAAFPGDRLRRGLFLEGAVNLTVQPYAGTLVAAGEQGLPWELDPETLATRGPYDFRGSLNDVTPFGAHAHLDPRNGELVNFGVSFHPSGPRLTAFHFDGAGGLRWRRRHALPYPCAIHDFALGTGHLAFWIGPHLLDGDAFLGLGQSFQDSLHWRPDLPGRLLVLRREDGSCVLDVPVPPSHCLHPVRLGEDGGDLLLDLIVYPAPIYGRLYVGPDFYEGVSEARVLRMRVRDGAVDLLAEHAYRRAPEFPATDRRRFGDPSAPFWGLGCAGTYYDEVFCLDFAGREEVWRAPRGWWLTSEPLYAEGSLVVLAGSATASEAWVFDAERVPDGPRARMPLPRPLSTCVHGSWRPR